MQTRAKVQRVKPRRKTVSRPGGKSSVARQLDPCTRYAEDVISGKITACRFVVQACERHLHDLGAGEFVWSPKEAQLAIDFFPLLKHYKGPMAGQPFVLSGWQEFLVGSIFGWRRADGLRRFREAYVEIPRKNGKSTLAAGVALMLFLLDNESGAEIYTVATKEEQAKIVWESGKVMVEKSRPLRKRVRVLRNTMHYDKSFSIFRPLGRDSKTHDGLNPSGAVGDEMHAWPDSGMYDVIDSAFGGRDQPIFFIITTAGVTRECFCFRHRNHCLNVLNGYKSGVYDDPQLFVYIATIDEGDDPFAETTWYKANPELGAGKQLDYMRSQAKKAQQLATAKNNFLTKQLNVWIESASTWLKLERWDKCQRKVNPETLAGRRAWGGLDLASSTDFAACVWLIDNEGALFVRSRIWLPEKTLENNDRLRDKRVLSTIKGWADAGLIELTPGDWIDHDFIEARLREDAGLYDIVELGYDPYNAGNLPLKLEEDGIRCTAIGQGFKHMNPAAQEFERRVLSERIHHDGNPVLRWMLGNVVMRHDPNGNIRPDKAKSHEKIDGIVALLLGLNRAMSEQEQPVPGIAFL
jgi:phage terminase large subunit-like protein